MSMITLFGRIELSLSIEFGAIKFGWPIIYFELTGYNFQITGCLLKFVISMFLIVPCGSFTTPNKHHVCSLSAVAQLVEH